MVVDNTDKILSIIRQKGPVIPSQIHNEIDSSILVASATLGELTSKNKLRISNLKIGGTPLYYLPGQESRLQDFENKLPGQEKRAYDLIKQRVVLQDLSLTPVTRVALRQIKDFAKPLQVNNKGNIELFWKWYLTPNEEAEKFIKKILGPIEEKKSEPSLVPVEEKKIPPPSPAEQQATLEPVKEEKKTTIKPIKKIKKETNDAQFLDKIINYFKSNNITILEQTVIRKNAEMEFIIEVPSAVGSLIYFCKAKSKKKVTDGDLSSTYFQGQTKKIPPLFLGFGDLTKKAKEMLEKEFRGMTFKKL